MTIKSARGSLIIELLIAIALAGLVIPAILTGLVASREGKVQQEQRLQAVPLLRETVEAVKSVRQNNWTTFAVNGTFHPVAANGSWSLVSGTATVSGFVQSVVISDVNRNASGAIVTNGGTLDPSTKKVYVKISWTQPQDTFVDSTLYLTRYRDNFSCVDTTQTDFNKGTLVNTQVTNTAGGEVILANNNKAKWCSPSFSSATIDLPDGPPVSVAATASAVTASIPNDVFVATAPYATSSVKLAYLNVTANTDPPIPTLRGTFTLDPAKYSTPSAVPTGINLDNSFITNSVTYYRSSGNKLYALLGTNKPDHEVIVVQLRDGNNDTYQDATNKIYKYWTFFNTRIYQGNNASLPNQDQSPYGYGAVRVAVLGNRGYTISGGFLYVFDLSNIDSKTPSSGLDMVGCRIQLDGYDCNPATSRVRKYAAGSTGTNFQAELAGQVGCMDGGAVQPYADNDLFPIQVGASTYVYFAVGAGTNPELDIANVTSVPTSGTSPRISSRTCGTIASGNAGWKRVSSLDFNSATGTQETANSVFGKSDGTRAYIASNGGVDANGDGHPDADQFYVVDTTTKTSPHFLSGTPATGATSGYYNGDATNIQMFPRRSLTVLNGQRAVLVGQDGFPNDGITPQTYQVVKIDNEVTPSYCGGLGYAPGFNDLTSVVEADFDTFVYLVANTNEKQLKIIQGGPDGTYVDSGSYESSACSSNYATAFNRILSTISQPSNTTVQAQVAVSPSVSGSCTGATYNYVGPDGTSGTFYTPNSASISGSVPFSINPGQCFRYKLFFNTTDYNATPQVNDFSTNYSP